MIQEYQLPKFLVIRFAPGSAGNFLTSLLQCSPQVGHWFEDIEYQRPNVDWLEYFKKVYVSDLSQWLYNEPVAKQQLGVRDIFSAAYDRGNDLTLKQFKEQEQQYCSKLYWDLRQRQVYIPIFWHKRHFPIFFQNAAFIDIMLDQESVSWFDRSYYKKHFKIDTVNDDGSIIVCYQRHRSTIVPKTFAGTNQYKNYHRYFAEFVRKEIFANPWRARYLTDDYLKDSTHNNLHCSLKLSDLLNFDRLKLQYQNLCGVLSIDPMPEAQLLVLFNHWRQCHDY